MENNDKKLVVISHSITAIENQLTLGNKILSGKNKKNEIINFLIKFTIENGNCVESDFDAFVFVSNQYPLTYEQIEKYKNHLNFHHLSMNTKIDWFEGLIDLYLDLWNWKNLSSNTSLPWSIDFIKKYEDYWDWNNLCSNENLPWNKEFIEKYKNKFLEKYNYVTLSSNKGINWTEELIYLFNKYDSKEDFILYNHKICDGIFNKEGKKLLTQNFYIVDWRHHLKIIYDDKVFNNLENYDVCWSCVCRQIKKVNSEFLISNNSRIDWGALSQNENCLSEEIIETFKDKLCWDTLSENEKLPWSIELIRKFEDYWNWEYLSTNKGIPWNEDLIDAFIDKWNWEFSDSLSTNPKIPVSVDFINKYNNHIDLQALLYHNNGNFWTEDFINTFENHNDSWTFSHNESFPWSIDMINRFKRYYCSGFIHQKVIDEILPYLDDESVAYIFDKIIDSYE